jgi:hypothetical protein
MTQPRIGFKNSPHVLRNHSGSAYKYESRSKWYPSSAMSRSLPRQAGAACAYRCQPVGRNRDGLPLLQAHVRPTLEVVLTESPKHLHKRKDPEAGWH